jgi:hypothetical protein
MVRFESLNEPNGSAQEWAEQLNTMQTLMPQAINDVGVHDAKCVVVVGELGEVEEHGAVYSTARR